MPREKLSHFTSSPLIIKNAESFSSQLLAGIQCSKSQTAITRSPLSIFANFKISQAMKSATLMSGERNDSIESKPRQSENAKKIARLLKKRRELLEKEKLKLESEERANKAKERQKEVKDLNQRSEPTSEEYDDEEPETITENSDSYDSNDEFRVKVLSKDLDKG